MPMHRDAYYAPYGYTVNVEMRNPLPTTCTRIRNTLPDEVNFTGLRLCPCHPTTGIFEIVFNIEHQRLL
jgi:hypothetical protein